MKRVMCDVSKCVLECNSGWKKKWFFVGNSDVEGEIE